MQLTTPIYHGWFAITPSDTVLLNLRAIYVGGAGNITISYDNSTAGVVFTAPPVGSILPLALNQGRVMAASTATLLVGLT